MSAFDWPSALQGAAVAGGVLAFGLTFYLAARLLLAKFFPRCPTGYMWLHRQVAEMERAEQVARKGKRK